MVTNQKVQNLIILDRMKIVARILRWLPAILVMVIIFGFSSIPSREMPSFGFWDLLVKKGAHMLGYGLLALLSGSVCASIDAYGGWFFSLHCSMP